MQARSNTSAKQETYRKARDTSRLILKPNMSLTNKIMFLTAIWMKDKQTWALQELKDVLALAYDDVTQMVAPEYESLRLFTDPVEEGVAEMKEEEAAAVVREAVRLWPELTDVTPRRILVLKKGLTSGDLVLKYRYLRGFLAWAAKLWLGLAVLRLRMPLALRKKS